MTQTLAVPSQLEPVSFEDLGLPPDVLHTLEKLDFHTPTDIQRAMIPPALRGEDCLGQARTGTGKTAAFALPMLERIDPKGGLQALVLTPTRELALQVYEHVRMLGAHRSLKTLTAYGGTRVSTNLRRLQENPKIVIGTPGRILDLMQRKALDLSRIRIVVLDEVDRMLDIGFRDDIRRILHQVKSEHQTLFVSATIDADIRKLARTFMHDPVEINVSSDRLTVEGIEQSFVSVQPRDKYKTLRNFLKHEKPRLAIVFTNTKAAARRIAERLKRDGVKCKEIHGDLVQRRRERVMQSFRKAHIQVLVATDLASRGLDVMEISHIVNYDVPEDPYVYVHRVGRTARMGQSGYAVTLVTPEQGKPLTEIEKLINMELTRLEAPWVVQREPEAAPPPDVGDGNGKADDGVPTGVGRFRDALYRDVELDTAGVKPLPRTLGSRFRRSRRRR